MSDPTPQAKKVWHVTGWAGPSALLAGLVLTAAAPNGQAIRRWSERSWPSWVALCNDLGAEGWRLAREEWTITPVLFRFERPWAAKPHHAVSG